MRYMILAGVAVLFMGMAGCDLLGIDEDDDDEVEAPINIGFSVVETDDGAAAAAVQQNAQGDLTITGNNGTLTITGLVMLVSDFELDNDEDAEFDEVAEAVNLHLDGEVTTVVEERPVPVGEYTEFQFDVEDLVAENNGEVNIDSLRAQLSDLGYDPVPDSASVVAVGSFTPANGGGAQSFTTYLDADAEVETELNPPLNVAENDTTGGVLVEVDPADWFVSEAGDVMDLSASDGALADIEGPVSDGITARAVGQSVFNGETAAARIGR